VLTNNKNGKNKMNIQSLKEKIIRLEEKRNLLQKDKEKNEQSYDSWYNRYKKSNEAKLLIQKVSEETQNKLTFYIEDLVTSCLNAIQFEEQYEYKLEFQQKRNQTEGYLWLVTENGDKLKPVDDVGGGVNDILSIGNMIAFWCLSPNRPFMLWDEHTKHLSKEYSEAAGNMIRVLTEEKDIQVLMVTHDRVLAESSNNVIEL